MPRTCASSSTSCGTDLECQSIWLVTPRQAPYMTLISLCLEVTLLRKITSHSLTDCVDAVRGGGDTDSQGPAVEDRSSHRQSLSCKSQARGVCADQDDGEDLYNGTVSMYMVFLPATSGRQWCVHVSMRLLIPNACLLPSQTTVRAFSTDHKMHRHNSFHQLLQLGRHSRLTLSATALPKGSLLCDLSGTLITPVTLETTMEAACERIMKPVCVPAGASDGSHLRVQCHCTVCQSPLGLPHEQGQGHNI